MDNKTSIGIFGMALGFLIAGMLFSSSASANLVVQPAKLGIIRLQLYPLSPAVAVRELTIGNTYNVSMSVSLDTQGQLVNVVTLSDSNFTLGPNTSKVVQYTISTENPGYYSGSIEIKVGLSGRGAVAFQDNLSLIVTQADMKPYIFGAISLAAAVVAAALFWVGRKPVRGKGK